ncbi:putative acetate--CoA ligase [Helianthus anomalus]
MNGGHRIGSAEVESALVSHPNCAEAAVVGVEHEVKGQCIYSEDLKKCLMLSLRTNLDDLGDISTLADPNVVEQIIALADL